MPSAKTKPKKTIRSYIQKLPTGYGLCIGFTFGIALGITLGGIINDTALGPVYGFPFGLVLGLMLEWLASSHAHLKKKGISKPHINTWMVICACLAIILLFAAIGFLAASV